MYISEQTWKGVGLYTEVRLNTKSNNYIGFSIIVYSFSKCEMWIIEIGYQKSMTDSKR